MNNNAKMPLPNSVKKAIDILENNDFEAYVVGGCVRDFVMGKMPHDFDMTTNATPAQMLNIFSGYTTIDAGVKHGTVAVMIDSEKIEITTYRIDGEYNDARHPVSVVFSSNLRDDTLRRDFTVNAMAYSEKNGIVDFNGGLCDIENKIIRAVGEPEKRFEEDALRILRAVRFSSVLGFDIEGKTLLAAKKHAGLLKKISAERICEELDKFLAGNNVGFLLDNFAEIFAVVLPEIYPLSQEKRKALDFEFENLFVSYAMLLEGLQHNTVKKICERLKFSNERKKRVLAILSVEKTPLSKLDVKLLLSLIGRECFEDFLKFQKAHSIDVTRAEKFLSEIEEKDECYSLKGLAVDGKDLISIGVTNGEKIGKSLAVLLDKVMREELENTKEALLSYLQQF